MTMALCFRCGHTKFGAICPCPKCNVASTGNVELDILFSDHHMTVRTINAFGDVVRSIRGVCEDDELCFWSFMQYISINHQDLLKIDLPPERTAECDAVLARADPPPVEKDLSPQKRLIAAESSEKDAGRRKRWWQFWK